MENMTIVLMIGAAVLLLLLFFRVLRLPLKWAAKAAIHVVIGFIALFVLNFLGSWVGIYIEMNWINSLITGLLGVPGVLLLLLIKYVL